MKPKQVLVTCITSLIGLGAFSNNAESQLAPLKLWMQFSPDSFNIEMPTQNVEDKVYGGVLSWLDIAFAQAYGVTVSWCKKNPGSNEFTFRFHSQKKVELTHKISCSKAYKLASEYGLIGGRSLRIGSNANEYEPTLNLNTEEKSKNFRAYRKKIFYNSHLI